MLVQKNQDLWASCRFPGQKGGHPRGPRQGWQQKEQRPPPPPTPTPRCDSGWGFGGGGANTGHTPQDSRLWLTVLVGHVGTEGRWGGKDLLQSRVLQQGTQLDPHTGPKRRSPATSAWVFMADLVLGYAVLCAPQVNIQKKKEDSCQVKKCEGDRGSEGGWEWGSQQVGRGWGVGESQARARLYPEFCTEGTLPPLTLQRPHPRKLPAETFLPGGQASPWSLMLWRVWSHWRLQLTAQEAASSPPALLGFSHQPRRQETSRSLSCRWKHILCLQLSRHLETTLDMGIPWAPGEESRALSTGTPRLCFSVSSPSRLDLSRQVAGAQIPRPPPPLYFCIHRGTSLPLRWELAFKSSAFFSFPLWYKL